MKRLLLVGTMPAQRAEIKQICGKSFIIDDADKLTHNAFLDINYAAVLIMIDENPEQVIADIEHFTLKPIHNAPPVIVATRKPEALYIRKAIRRGAIDYIDLNRHYFLIQNRIMNVMRLSIYQPAQQDSINRLLFYRCIGPAQMLEVSEDFETVHQMMVNSDYFETVGIQKDFYDNVTNMLDTVLPEELDSTRQALRLASVNGISECHFSNSENGRSFRGTYRLVLKEEGSYIMLLTLQDVTEREMTRSVHENMLRLPGMTLFTYDPETDSASFLITTKKNKKITKSHKYITDPNKQKIIAPESFMLFSQTIHEASQKKITGNIDIRVLVEGDLKWYRMYYRSIPDSSGKITKIVGRMDDMESEDYMDVRGIQSGLCDAETHLPTFRTAFQFIDQTLREHKQGTLMLVYIKGLDQASESMSTFVYQTFLQEIVKTINNHFISTDVIGRFATQCFMVFMPETTSRNLAPKKAAALIKAVQDLLPSEGFQVNIGICIIGPQHSSLETIVSEANIALWNAVEAGNGRYLIFDNDEQD